MGWIYSAELADLPWHSSHGYDPSPIVSRIDTASQCFCPQCDVVIYHTGLSRPTCEHFAASILIFRSTSFTADSPARTSLLQELEWAWEESEAACFSSSSDSLANFDPDSFSWKTSQISLFETWNEFSWSSLRFGMIVAGRLFQPANLAPNIAERDGGFWPTPCARDYRSPGIGRQRKANLEDRRGIPLSVWYRLEFGKRLTPSFVEWMMGYAPSHTVLGPSEMQLYQSKLGRRSCDLAV